MEKQIIMKEPELHKINIKRTAHYYTLGTESKTAKDIWLVLHGYGQLASRIIRKFDQLDLSEKHIIAPEALNKFYFKREPLTLGATWMTMHQRLDEIQDYLHYLDEIYTSLELSSAQSFNVLGFSQGSATIMRWLDHARPPVSRMINWAGEFPPDIDYDLLVPYLNTIPQKYYCVGDKDSIFTQDKVKLIVDFIAKTDPSISVNQFSGKHEINRDLLATLIDN